MEAGVHPEENRVNQVVDRVNATGTTWLGTTMECAQCHSHKYDPFSQEEYFEMFAFFNNTPLEVENKSGKGVSFDFWGPKMELPLPADKQKQRDSLNAELEVKKRSLPPCKRKRIGITRMDSAKIGSNQREGIRVASAYSHQGSFDGGESLRIVKDGSLLAEGNPETNPPTKSKCPSRRYLEIISNGNHAP